MVYFQRIILLRGCCRGNLRERIHPAEKVFFEKKQNLKERQKDRSANLKTGRGRMMP